MEKEIFAKLYEKVVGKAFSSKTAVVSDANLEKMQAFAAKLPKNISEKKVEKKKEEADKVLKSDEISFGGGGFLSGLGFGKTEEKVEEKIDLDEFFGKNEPVATTSKVDIFDIASRATVEKRNESVARNTERGQGNQSRGEKPSGGYQGKPNYQGNKPRKTG